MRIFFTYRISLFRLLPILLCFFIGSCKKDKKVAPDQVLQVQSYYPNSGKAGTLVTIEGSGFDTDIEKNTVEFGGVKGEVLSSQSNRLVARAPEGGKTGNIKVSNGSAGIEIGTYTYQSLSIKRVDPANGPAGSHIGIYGTGFNSLQSPPAVTINGKNALVGTANDTLLVVEVPAAAGSGPIEVKVDGMTARGQSFTYQAIGTVKPLSGGKGTKVRISGEGFETLVNGNIVDFNGKKARVLEASGVSLLVEAPEGVVTGPIAVTVNGQRSTGPVFTRVPVPDITEVSPLSGPAGMEMTIKGANFSALTDENIVRINGVEVPVKSATEKELKLVIPGGTGSGTVVVTVNDQRTDGPQFKDQQLGISDITPDNGLAGSIVTISGSGFDSNPSANRVTFNGLQAQVTAASGNKLTVVAPAQVTTGVVRVNVSGHEALAPREFRRAGVVTLATGLSVSSLTTDAQGNLFVIDGRKQQILKFSNDGHSSVIAGNITGSGIAVDKQGNIYVANSNLAAIYKISPSGTVSTLISNVGPVGKMVIRPNNSIVVAVGSSGMFSITPDGTVDNISPVTPMYDRLNVQFAMDNAGGVYYVNNSEYPNINYNPITSGEDYYKGFGDGEYGGYYDAVGRNAKFSGSFGALAGDGKGHILVADSYYIRSIDIANRQVSTFLKLNIGDRDGSLRDAQLNFLNGMAIAPDGVVYVSQNNGSIRKIFFR